MSFSKTLLGFACMMTALAAAPAMADDQVYELTLKNHLFTPDTLKIPADKPAILHIKNMDNSAEEFDSDDLKTEKVISAGGEGTVHLKPLKAGKYKFEGEYHDDTAQGILIAE